MSLHTAEFAEQGSPNFPWKDQVMKFKVTLAMLAVLGGCANPELRSSSGGLPDGVIKGPFAHCLKVESFNSKSTQYQNTCNSSFTVVYCYVANTWGGQNCEERTVFGPTKNAVYVSKSTVQMDTCPKGEGVIDKRNQSWAHCANDPTAVDKKAAARKASQSASKSINLLGGAMAVASNAPTYIANRDAQKQTTLANKAAARGDASAAIRHQEAALNATSKAVNHQVAQTKEVIAAGEDKKQKAILDRRSAQVSSAENIEAKVSPLLKSHVKGDEAPEVRACLVEYPQNSDEIEAAGGNRYRFAAWENRCSFHVSAFDCRTEPCSLLEYERVESGNNFHVTFCPGGAYAKSGECFWSYTVQEK